MALDASVTGSAAVRSGDLNFVLAISCNLFGLSSVLL